MGVPALVATLLIGVGFVPVAAQSRADAPGPPSNGFSAAVALQGDELFVGRPGELGLFPLPANRTGAVHVYRRSGAGWEEAATVVPSGNELGIGFGDALDADGDWLLVGAPRDGDSGAAYVFQRDGTGWREVARLTPAEGTAGEGFGTSVAIHDGTALVAAPGRAPGGAVVVYRRGEDGTWARAAGLTPPEGGPGARFGTSVDLADGRAAIGAPGDMIALIPGPTPPNLLPGATYVYDASGTDWALEGTLESGQEGPGGLGWVVRIRDGAVWAAAPFANQFSGGAFRFERAGDGAWSLAEGVAPTDAPPQALAGVSMAFAGDDLMLGAPLLGGGNGGAIVFGPGAEGGYAQTQVLVSSLPFAFFGFSLAGEPGLAVLGAPGEAFFEGTGHVYARNDTSGEWTEEAALIDEGGGPEAVVGGTVECRDGAAASYDCEEIDLLAFVPVRGLGGGRGVIVNDLWGWTDPETHREYAIVGRNDGTAFVDVTDPANPVFLGDLPLTEGAAVNMWRDMKVYANHAFIVADNAGQHGMQVFDLTQLRDVAGAPVTFRETAHYDGIASAHNIVVNEDAGFAYIVGSSGGGQTCGGGLHMVDIRDPLHPVFAGCFSDASTGHASTGYSHDAQCIVYHGPDEEHAGREICFGANENALSVADVSDKENPQPLAAVQYPNSAYLHQGWVSDDHRYFYMNDELDELAGVVPGTRTLVWDIEDLDDPVLVEEHVSENRASDHNLYVRGTLMYQSNYLSGLRILDISDPAHPVEVGHFDTVPQGGDVPGFAGSWSNYPFFESGIILVSSIREGLFVLRKKTTPVT